MPWVSVAWVSRLCLLAACVWLGGCTALHTSIAKKDLDVQNRMTATVYLDPVDPELRSVFVDIRQTAPEYQLPLKADIVHLLAERGYRLVDSPLMAQYWLQVNVRTVLKERPEVVLASEQYEMTEAEIEALLNPALSVANAALADVAGADGTGGDGGDTADAAVVAPVAARPQSNRYVYLEGGSGRGSSVSSKDVMQAIAVIAVLAGAEYAGRQMVRDVYYTMITDIQVAERLPDGSDTWVQEIGQHHLLQGDSGALEQIWEQATDRRKYQVRLISFANQANLKWPEAEAGLHRGLLRALAGIF